MGRFLKQSRGPLTNISDREDCPAPNKSNPLNQLSDFEVQHKFQKINSLYISNLMLACRLAYIIEYGIWNGDLKCVNI